MSGPSLSIFARRVSFLCACAGLAVTAACAQAPDASVYRHIDAAVQHRVKHIAGFTDIERYDVYHGRDQSHPAAEITVKMTYRRGVGRSYKILSQHGSYLIRKFGLITLLNDETQLSQPGSVERTWFTTANYQMKLKSPAPEPINGYSCYALAIMPRHKAPNAIIGTLWVDAKDGSIVKVQGVASRRPSILAGTTHMMRDYKKVDGYAMATSARAVSNGPFIGRTVVTVEYSNYHLMFYPVPAPTAAESMAAAASD